MNQVRLLPFAKGLASFVPGSSRFFCSSSGGTTSARYCYAVWMRHLIKAKEAGFDPPYERVAELGPGDSIGAGLCAILCGTKEYYALDAKPHAGRTVNLEVLKGLVQLLTGRTAIPDETEFPSLHPFLDDYSFPRHILGDDDLERFLRPDRIDAIERTLNGEASTDDTMIRYIAPWQGRRLLEPQGGLDLVFSQAVMEHVEDISGTYLEILG